MIAHKGLRIQTKSAEVKARQLSLLPFCHHIQFIHSTRCGPIQLEQAT